MVKLTLTDLLSKQEIIDLWNDVYAVIIDDGKNVVFKLIHNTHLETDTYGFIDDGEWTPRTDDFLVLNWDKHISVFEDKEIVRISIIDKSEYKTNELFGINVTLKFSHGVDAESYEEAVEVIKNNFLEQYNIELQDYEIDPIEFDLRSVLNLLDANGYEDASNFLQLHFAEEEE